MSQDATKSMPEAGTGDLGAALRGAVTGKETPSTVNVDDFTPEVNIPNSSNLDDLARYQEAEPSTQAGAEAQAAEPAEPAPSAEPEAAAEGENSDLPEIELKVKGYKEPQKIKLDPNDEKVKQLLGKGMRFEKVMQESAQQRKDLEQKLQQYQDYEQKAQMADRVEQARKLMEEGYSEHALETILGESTQSFIDHLVEERVKYQNASPEERLQMDLERHKKAEQLKREQDADRIAQLEAQINARSEKAQEAEFSGYIEDAKGRYDLSQWVDDTDVAQSLNDMLHSAAMADIIKLQRQREARGEDNISQKDIRRAYATRAKQLIKHSERQSSKMADQKVSQQAEVAKQNAQVASTKNYGQPDVMSEWKQQKGSMSELVDMFSRNMGRRGTV